MSWKRKNKCAGNAVFHIMSCGNLKRPHSTEGFLLQFRWKCTGLIEKLIRISFLNLSKHLKYEIYFLARSTKKLHISLPK